MQFLNENFRILIEISLKLIFKCPTDNKLLLFQTKVVNSALFY